MNDDVKRWNWYPAHMLSSVDGLYVRFRDYDRLRSEIAEKDKRVEELWGAIDGHWKPRVNDLVLERDGFCDEVADLKNQITRLHGLVASARDWIDPEEHPDWEEQASEEATSCSREIERLRARIEELGHALEGHAAIEHCHGDEDGVPCVSHLAYLAVTNNEHGVWVDEADIDAAWAEVPQHEYDQGSLAPAEALAPLLKLGIVACPECGGSGDKIDRSEEPGFVEDDCPDCHGHGWVWKETSDEGQQNAVK